MPVSNDEDGGGDGVKSTVVSRPEQVPATLPLPPPLAVAKVQSSLSLLLPGLEPSPRRRGFSGGSSISVAPTALAAPVVKSPTGAVTKWSRLELLLSSRARYAGVSTPRP